MTDHDRLRRIAGNATPGPWWNDWSHEYPVDDERGLPIAIVSENVPNGGVFIVDDRGVGALNANNAEFIAAWNPETALALLDELRDAKAKLQEAKAEGYERAVRDARQYALPSVGLVAIGMQNPYRETR